MADYKIKKNELQGSEKIHAVIFTGGEAPEPQKTLSYWNSSLAFSDVRLPDFIIAADSGLETLRAYSEYFGERDSLFRQGGLAKPVMDFSPDLILGDFDSLSDPGLLAFYPDRIIERSPSYKDLTDTELALSAVRKKFKKVFITLVGGAGGRADHFLGIFNLFGTELSPDAWLCGDQVLFNAHKRNFFVQNLSPASPVSVARAASNSKGSPKIKTHGLEWESPLFRKRGMPSISNTVSLKYFKEKLPVEFYFKHGKFVLILPLEAKVTVSE